VVCLEDLQVKNMVKNHCLAKSITDGLGSSPCWSIKPSGTDASSRKWTSPSPPVSSALIIQKQSCQGFEPKRMDLPTMRSAP
jgi:hypothetical protein